VRLTPSETPNQTNKTNNQISMKKVLLLASAFALLFAVTQQANAGGTSGTHNGFYYFTYYTGSGSTSISFGSGGNFVGHWTSGVTDSLVGEGWAVNNQVRNIGYNAGVLSGNLYCAGEYSWTPNVESYICDFGANPYGTYSGTVNSDGGTYNVYKDQVSSTFVQYKDNRQNSQSRGQNHTITMSNHVNNWRSKGWNGTFGYPCWVAEALGGPGDVNCTIW
jgi:endo-1,4-beta-xylanase